MLALSARVRPKRSATTPKIIPPAAEARSVSDPSIPAVLLTMWKSFIRAARTMA